MRTKVEVYEAWKSGDITDEEAEDFFGSEWDEVQKFRNAEEIIASQPEPDVDDSELFKDQ